MAPVTPPPAAEEPVLSVPMPERPVVVNGLQSLILPIGIAVGAVLALLLQGVIVRRRSYRRGFEDGIKHAAEDELIAEWEADSAVKAPGVPAWNAASPSSASFARPQPGVVRTSR
jgi:hypothetical protein